MYSYSVSIFSIKFFSVNFNGTDARELISDIVITPDGVAVDWVNDRLFWTDTGTNTISSINISGDKDSLMHIVKDDLEEPRAIVIHPGKK